MGVSAGSQWSSGGRGCEYDRDGGPAAHQPVTKAWRRSLPCGLSLAGAFEGPPPRGRDCWGWGRVPLARGIRLRLGT